MITQVFSPKTTPAQKYATQCTYLLAFKAKARRCSGLRSCIKVNFYPEAGILLPRERSPKNFPREALRQQNYSTIVGPQTPGGPSGLWHPKILKMNKRRQKQNYIYKLLVVAPRFFEASYRTATVAIAPYCLNAATAHWIKTTLFCYKMSKSFMLVAPFQGKQRF